MVRRGTFASPPFARRIWPRPRKGYCVATSPSSEREVLKFTLRGLAFAYRTLAKFDRNAYVPPGRIAKYGFTHQGHCEICESEVVFHSIDAWFRDHLHCSLCGSIPRQRALMRTLGQVAPDYPKLEVYEASPALNAVSARLREECRSYTVSNFCPDVSLGDLHPQSGVRCEDLERLTFADGSFDLVVTQEVMEHVFDPKAAFQSIERVLKPGGMHVFTAPLVNKFSATEVRASLLPSGEIVHHFEPDYHGNPIDPDGNPIDAQGSLMTMNWGYDIAASILEWTGMRTLIVLIDDLDAGIRADINEVVVSQKVEVP